MIEAYKPIIENLLVEEVKHYYNKLFSIEQMSIIDGITDDFKWFKQDEDYYKYKFKTVKENPKLIRLVKQQTLTTCQSEFN